MHRPLLLVGVLLGAHALPGCAAARSGPALPPPVTSDRDTIRAFSGPAELADFVEQLFLEGRREYDREHANDPPPPFYPDIIYHPPPPPPRPAGVPVQSSSANPPSGSGVIAPTPPAPRPAPAPAPGPPAPTSAAPASVSGGTPPPASPPAVGTAPQQTGRERPATGAAAVAGVDAGGIVKAVGDYLVVLHRGRLFTVRVAGGALQPVSAVDAFGPGVPAEGRTYGRLLVSGERVIVLGTLELGGGFDSTVQVGVFRLAPDGRLTHQATYGLRSLDPYRRYYHASQPDAVRLVGDRLVLYVPMPVERKDPLAGFPLVRGPGVVSSTAAATPVYRPAGRVSTQRLHLHALTTCDLGGDAPRCTSTSLLAGGDRPFHVSPTAVYLWASQPESWAEDAPERSVLYRIPLDGSAPTALRVEGGPSSEHAFLERDGVLYVLLHMAPSGAPAQGAEYSPGRLALLRVPLSAFGSGRDAAPAAHYRALAPPWGQLHHRFIGDWLVYGLRDTPVGASSTVHAVRLEGGAQSQVVVPYRLDRVETMGDDALLAGTDDRDQYVDVVRLGPDGLSLTDRRNLGAGRVPLGLHYRPDGEGEGVLGIPFRGPHYPGYEQLGLGSASILFLHSREHRLSEMGELASGEPTGNDACVGSCGWWYGNAHPLFLGGRILALLGYELVEGREEGGRIRELRRVNLAPTVPTAAVAGAWEFTETIGPPQGRYRCANLGTMWLDPAGNALRMRYRQTGECTVDGTTTRSDGEGSGTGTLSPDGMTLDVNGCRYQGVMLNADTLRAFVSCRIPMPSGHPLDVTGQLEARRAGR